MDIGALIMNWQVFDALGIALGFVANGIASIAGAFVAQPNDPKH